MLITLTSLATGVLSGMAVGGGSVLVPALVFLFSIPQHQAQAAVLAAFLGTSTVATLTHYSQKNIKLKLVGLLVIGSVVGALFGSLMAARTGAPLLKKLYGVYLLVIAVVAFFAKDPVD